MMEKTSTNYFRVLKLTAAIGVLGLVGCAHEINPVKFSPTAIPTVEMMNMRLLLNQAQESQVDVLASVSFKKADNFLTDAQAKNAKGIAPDKVLETLGLSKAYLNKAVVDSVAVRPNVSAIAEARVAAISAGARSFPKDLNFVDDKFKKMTEKPEASEKMTPNEKSYLQTQYQNLELAVIKTNALGESKSIINLAKKKGAEKITPLAFKDALEKISVAERIIETDRHSTSKIAEATAVAKASSMRVFALLESEKNSRNQTPEQRAMTLEARDLALKEANLNTSEIASESMIKDEKITGLDQKIASQNESLAYSEGANQELLKREYDEKIVNNAAAQFDKFEADVYRQDGNLVIRLKTMNFASNRSDLPSESFLILNKVKNIMKDLTPESVMIEGHTDAVGNLNKNQKLSELRAQAVMKYFSTEKYLGGNILDSTGFGYSKPLATNKTKEGRAQNRRVDIIIKTSGPKNL